MARRELTFRGGARTAVGFVAAISLALVVMMPVKEAAEAASAWGRVAYEFGKFVPLVAIGAVALRREGISVRKLGLSARHFVPAAVTFGGVWVALNLSGIGLAEVNGYRWELGVLRETAPVLVEGVPAPRVTTLLYFFAVVGVVEELLFRGYLQTKLIALLGDDTRLRIALGILTAGLVFGLAHVPGALVAGASVRGALSLAAITAASGIAFGVLYEATRNLYFVALLHGLGDTWPLVVDVTEWSGNALAGLLAVGAGTYLAGTLAYRYWALGTDLTPVVRRSEASSSGTTGGVEPAESPEIEKNP